ncbi:unnamed protein product, partial [marine sediment metagenome]
LLQITLALIVAYCVQQSTDLGTEIYVPFLKKSIELGIVFVPFVVLVMVSSVNAVNLTDGLDGLAVGLIIIAMLSFALTAYIQNIGSMVLFSLIVAFTSLGFLVYNFFPAQIFLGDVGSLTLGGALASVAIFTRTELFLLIIGGVFAIETLSVILQVVSVKLRGKIIFKMSPIHHHFELCGWKEPKIIKEVLKSGSFKINKNITNIIIKGGNTPLRKVFISFTCFLVKDSAIYRIKANLAISEG